VSNDDERFARPGDGSDGGERASAAATADADATPVVLKICPACSAAERTAGEFCPFCGASYAGKRKRRMRRRTKVIMAVVVALVLGGGATAALVAKHNHDQEVQRAQEARAARLRAERQAEARRQAAAEQARREQAAEDRLTRSMRRSLVADLRQAITKDARERVAEGLLDGPIYGTQCDPVGGGNLSDLDARTGRYDCLAYNVKHDDGTIEGYRFSATVNYDRFSYSWHLGG
jgi:hypothetical protein